MLPTPTCGADTRVHGVETRRDALALASTLAFSLLFTPGVQAASPVLEAYDAILEKLSEPPASRWQHFAAPYFSTNEKLLNRFYSRFDGLGGVTVGVSFQQNLSLLVHAHPKLCVIVDYNPGMTEILVPFMGELIAASPTRRDFVGALLGADVTEDQLRRLIENRTPAVDVFTEILEKTPNQTRQARLAKLRDAIAERVPPGANAATRKQVRGWIDVLEDQELLTGVFFADAMAPYIDPVSAQGWLSTEENYKLVRDYWQAGQILGVTGDISGEAIDRLGKFLRDRGDRVRVFYISNVGLSIEGHFPETWFRNLYNKLGAMPVGKNTLTLVAHGPRQLTGWVRSLDDAQWVYSELSGVSTDVAIRLHEAPLERLVIGGREAMFTSLLQGLETVNAPNVYARLIRAVAVEASAGKTWTAAAFGAWAKEQFAAVDAGSQEYKGILVALVESQVVRR